MKLTVENEVLADAAQWASRAIPNRPPAPVLAGMLLEAKKDSLAVSGFDYYVSARATDAADVDETGRALVSGRLLTDIVRSLPKQPATLALEATDLVITCGRARFTLPTLPLEEYPSLPKLPAASGTVNGAAFADLVTRVVAACGHDSALPLLSGIEITIDGDRLTFSATDRYRFHVAELGWTPKTTKTKAKPKAKTDGENQEGTEDDGEDQAQKIVVTGETLKDAARVVADSEQATLAFTDGMIAVSTADRVMTAGLLDGQLPNYRSLFPTEFPTVVTASTADLAAVVKRVAMVLAKSSHPLFLDITGDEITVKAGTHDTGMGLDCLPATIEQGTPLMVAFNAAFLLETLHTVADERVQLNFTSATKPALLHAPDQADTYRALLMPIRTTETAGSED